MKVVTSRGARLNESVFGSIGGGMDPTMFAGSSMVQGTETGYKYEILPFNDVLQQRPNKKCSDSYIYPGCTVRGRGLIDKSRMFKGQVYRIVKAEDGHIRYVYVKTEDTNRFVPVAADDELHLVTYKNPQNTARRSVFEGLKKTPCGTPMHLLECEGGGRRYCICLDGYESPEKCVGSLLGRVPNSLRVSAAYNIPKCFLSGDADEMLMDPELWKYVKMRVAAEVKSAVADYLDGYCGDEYGFGPGIVNDTLRGAVIVPKGSGREDFAKAYIRIKGRPCPKSAYMKESSAGGGFDYAAFADDLLKSGNWLETEKYMILL